MSERMPEVALWRAVIAQSINDATRGGLTNDNFVSRVERDHAREWLLKDNRDFPRVCHLALLDPGAVRDQARRMADGGWKPS